MTGRAVLVTSGKGGVGKTTTTANVGLALAMRGRRVVLVDANLGLRNLDLVLGLETQTGYDLGQVMAGKCAVEQAMVRDKRVAELYLIPAPEAPLATLVTPERIQEMYAQLKEQFDYVLIDSPNGLERGFRAVAAPADLAILVATPDIAAVCNADRVIDLLAQLRVPRPSLVVNRIRYRMVKRGDMLAIEDITELLGLPLLGLIPEHEDIVVAANRGLPSAYLPKSRCGRAFRQVAARLEGEEVPFTESKGALTNGRYHRGPAVLGGPSTTASSGEASALKRKLTRGVASGQDRLGSESHTL